jgi:hypothetical protein
MERSAALHVSRGQVDQAIEQYQECLAHIDRYPDDFDSDSRAWYREQIAQLRSKRARSS